MDFSIHFFSRNYVLQRPSVKMSSSRATRDCDLMYLEASLFGFTNYLVALNPLL